MKKFFIHLILFCSSALSHAEYKLSICAIFRDEARYLPEWIDFHLKQGVEHFYLYDHLSEDCPEDTLEPYIAKGIVEIIKHSHKPISYTHWNSIQCCAYMDCIKRCKDQTRWCAFIDTDEFLFSPQKRPLIDVIEEYREFAGICVNWVMYGTSNIELLPAQKITDFLVWRSKFDTPTNTHVKSIVNPKRIKACHNPHFFIYQPGFYGVDENGNPIYSQRSQKHSVNTLRINHYWSRDLWFFNNVKLKNRLWHYSEEYLRNCEKAYNAEYDPILQGQS